MDCGAGPAVGSRLKNGQKPRELRPGLPRKAGAQIGGAARGRPAKGIGASATVLVVGVLVGEQGFVGVADDGLHYFAQEQHVVGL